MKITFKDEVFEIEENTTILEFLKQKDEKLLKNACAAKLNGTLCDLRDVLVENSNLKILTFEDEEGKRAFWHTTAHILAQAIKRIFKKAEFGVGPSIENGFFYDVVTSPAISIKDFTKIEEEMMRIVKENLEVKREIISYDEARKMFEKDGQKYKLQLIEEIKNKGEKISIYKQGEFFDLCSGPHLISTGQVKAVKLLNLTGAYWKGDAENEMLSRVYGISFLSEESLKDYLTLREAAKRVDHRKLGKELKLFNFVEEGPGFCFFLPNGVIIKNSLIKYWRKEHEKAGYKEIITPTILSRKLWETSGHWEHYKENMYTTIIDEQDFAIKPMNCPGAILIYKMHSHSYKELPLRLCEFGMVHRHELSGTLHGLMRARCFTQDDAHIFLDKTQIKEEVKRIIELIARIYKKFGFSYSLELATMPEDHIGDEKTWDEATDSLKQAIEDFNINYKVNEKDGAFYGPKIDFYLKDCLNRRWQCGTVQLDFQLPQRFNLEFVGKDGQKHTPIMIHRVVYGSIERFIGILTEHFAGSFPFFIAPVQVKILPVSVKFFEFAKEVCDEILKEGFRVKVDLKDEKLGFKIRQAQLEKVPFTIIIGEREEKTKTISVRERKSTETTLEEFLTKLKEME